MSTALSSCTTELNNNETPKKKQEELPFPFAIEPIDDETNQLLLNFFKGERTGFVQVGPKKWFFPSKYAEHGKHFYNFQVRADDTWIVTFPRSGTTWTQEMVWLIANDLDLERAQNIPLTERFPFLEFSMFVHDEIKSELLAMNGDDEAKMATIEGIARPGWQTLSEMKSPRFIKTHFPFSLLPRDLLTSGCKVIYVARNPRDVAVSFYHLNRLFKTQGYIGDFATYWKFFKQNLHPWMPYWDHVEEGWEKRHEPNVLFMFYEEMSKDLQKCIQRVSNFLEKPLTDLQTARLMEHLNIENFSKNKAVNYDCLKELGFLQPTEQEFVRRGKSGDWQPEYSKELRQEAEDWIDEHLKFTHVQFPF